MYNLNLKSTPATEGRLTPQHPGASPGKAGDVYTYEIQEIPDDVPAAMVARLANTCVFAGARYQIRYADLREGGIFPCEKCGQVHLLEACLVLAIAKPPRRMTTHGGARPGAGPRLTAMKIEMRRRL